MPTPQLIDLVLVTLTGYFIMSHFCRLGVRKKLVDPLLLRQNLIGSFDYWLGLIVCMCAIAAIDLFAPYGNLFLLPLAACGLFNIIMDCMMFLLTLWIKLRTPKNEAKVETQTQQTKGETVQKEENNAPVQNEKSQTASPIDPYQSFY